MGKHLHELMGWDGPMTHRQYLAWQQWLNAENERVNRQMGRSSQQQDFQPVERYQTAEEASASAKARWGRKLGRR